ncbi:DGCR14, putative [Babesia ovata]|uniref:DGCR14, putative n=1 Tax=Babesia ovata TaxID=189622 RepID=A0A2H6KBP4_9APIC|nr:DGCR14, putative [Babesia ovata]GBE60404.1 DGCR14, putative [Babesia ovata]
MSEQQAERSESASSSHIANPEVTAESQHVTAVSLGELSTWSRYEGSHRPLRRSGRSNKQQTDPESTPEDTSGEREATSCQNGDVSATSVSAEHEDQTGSQAASTDSIFANTILDPNVDIASIAASSSANTLESVSVQSSALSIRAKNALKLSDTRRQDWRANAVSTVVKDPIVPYKDVLERIRTNYKLKELKEEDYIGCLETIIERDYFPDVVKLRLTNVLMEAESRGDTATAAVIRKRLEEHNNGHEMNVNLKTLGNENVSINIGKGGLKLDQFSRIFTSEDNRSFGRLMEQTIIRNNNRSRWMEEGEKKHNLALADTQQKTNLGIRDSNVLSNRAVSRNAFFFNQGDGKANDKSQAPLIRSTNTYMPPDYEQRLAELDSKQKSRRLEKVKDMYHGKVNDLITQFGFRECRELVDPEQMSKYNFVHTPLTAPNDPQEYAVPKPIPREELAEQLRKKYNSSSARTPMAKTPSCRTPLLVQRLIEKHNRGADMQLRESYSSSKRSRGSVRSGVSLKN